MTHCIEIVNLLIWLIYAIAYVFFQSMQTKIYVNTMFVWANRATN